MLQPGQLFGIQNIPLVAGGHARGFVMTTGALPQQTVTGLARHNSRASVSALQHAGNRIEAQAPFLLQRPVAGQAARCKQRLDLAEVLRSVGARRQKQKQRWDHTVCNPVG